MIKLSRILLFIHSFVLLPNPGDTSKDNRHYNATLQDVVQFVSRVLVLWVVADPRVPNHQCVLSPDIQRVVNLPVHVTHLPGRMEQALEEKRGIVDR